MDKTNIQKPIQISLGHDVKKNPLAVKPSLTPGLFLPLAFLLILTNFPGLHVMNVAVNPSLTNSMGPHLTPTKKVTVFSVQILRETLVISFIRQI